jgi:SOS-response transcriptional repressor LexA
MMTERQTELVAYVNSFRAGAQCNPTMAEIAERFGWASSNSAHEHLCLLSNKGVVSFRRGKARGYVVNFPWCDDARAKV